MDVRQHVEYWKSSSAEDLDVAEVLMRKRRFRHALFLAELAVEKLLKALVVQNTGTYAPKSHDLVKLAGLAGLPLEDDQHDALSIVQSFCLEGRYPSTDSEPLNEEYARRIFRRCKETLSWLTEQSKP